MVHALWYEESALRPGELAPKHAVARKDVTQLATH